MYLTQDLLLDLEGDLPGIVIKSIQYLSFVSFLFFEGSEVAGVLLGRVECVAKVEAVGGGRFARQRAVLASQNFHEAFFEFALGAIQEGTHEDSNHIV